MSGLIRFVGAGPGAADLITLRGARAIAEADIVIWAGSLVHPDLVAGVRPDAEVVDSATMAIEDMVPYFERAAERSLSIARVHTGDPSLYGAIGEQIERCRQIGLEVEVVPGVSAFSAVAARVCRELTMPEVSQSVILTRSEGGRTPMPDGETIRGFAAHGATMAVYLSAARAGHLQRELLAGGYLPQTPVVVAYRATWPDEVLVHCTVGTLAETVKGHRLFKHTLFLIGEALGDQQGDQRSRLYHPGHFHGYRKADPEARQTLRDQGLFEHGRS